MLKIQHNCTRTGATYVQHATHSSNFTVLLCVYHRNCFVNIVINISKVENEVESKIDPRFNLLCTILHLVSVLRCQHMPKLNILSQKSYLCLKVVVLFYPFV